jgi:hypothetical protein
VVVRHLTVKVVLLYEYPQTQTVDYPPVMVLAVVLQQMEQQDTRRKLVMMVVQV